MPSPFVGGRIPKDLREQLDAHSKKTGEDTATILRKALAAYLNFPLDSTADNSIDEKVNALEERITILESALDKISKQTTGLLEKSVPVLTTSPGQLSLLEPYTKAEVPKQNTRKENEDSVTSLETNETTEKPAEQGDAQSDAKSKSSDQLEKKEIDHEEMFQRTGIKVSTLRVYHSRRKKVTKKQFEYTPSGKKGQPTWIVEKLPI